MGGGAGEWVGAWGWCWGVEHGGWVGALGGGAGDWDAVILIHVPLALQN